MARILVVDDEAPVRELLREVLSGQGHEVVSAATIQAALESLADGVPGLVVLDLSFPEGSGADFLRAARQAGHAMPVIVYSGLVTAQLEKDLRLAGANEVLSKNVGIVPLVGQIERMFRAHHRFLVAGPRPARTLLVVDDEPSVRHLLRDFFQAKGYRIVEAEGGEQALELAARESPSVALLDVLMPGMDGLATLARLRDLHPRLGVVMVTGEQDDRTVLKAIELGAYSYVLKPFDLLYLQLVVLSKLIIAESDR